MSLSFLALCSVVCVLLSTFSSCQDTPETFGNSHLSFASLLHDFQTIYFLALGANEILNLEDEGEKLPYYFQEQMRMEQKLAEIFNGEWNMTVKHVDFVSSQGHVVNHFNSAESSGGSRSHTSFLSHYAPTLSNLLPTSSPVVILSSHPSPSPSFLPTPLKHMHALTLVYSDLNSQQSVLNALDIAASLHLHRLRHVRLVTFTHQEPHFHSLLRSYLVDGSMNDNPYAATSEVRFDVGNSIFLRSIEKGGYATGAKIANGLLRLGGGKHGVICTTQVGSSQIPGSVIEDFMLQLYGFHKERMPIGQVLSMARRKISPSEQQYVKDITIWLSKKGSFSSRSTFHALESLTSQELEEGIRFYLATLKWASAMKCDVLNIQSDKNYAPWGVSVAVAQSLLSTLHRRPPVFDNAGADSMESKMESSFSATKMGAPVLHYSLADQSAGIDTHFNRLIWEAFDVPLYTHLFSIAYLTNAASHVDIDESTDGGDDEGDTLLLLHSEYQVPFDEDSTAVWSRLVRNADDFTCYIGVGHLEIHRAHEDDPNELLLRLNGVKLRDFVHSYYTSQIQVTLVPISHEHKLKMIVAAKAGLCQTAGMPVVLSGATIHLIDEKMIHEFSAATHHEAMNGINAVDPRHDEL